VEKNDYEITKGIRRYFNDGCSICIIDVCLYTDFQSVREYTFASRREYGERCNHYGAYLLDTSRSCRNVLVVYRSEIQSIYAGVLKLMKPKNAKEYLEQLKRERFTSHISVTPVPQFSYRLPNISRPKMLRRRL
jgi:hypothetical protein